eukprot:TRINITY_DN25131_c0_g1_i1.p1 TRINITY_DN25131_c0_g1~~TRINITY_DN25131_c0_g1_i1.p1  ORF type:complete len:690 (+),score=89.02 TRINITY_DN25131_c0_g1_i1:75-2144(+)
MLRSGGRLLCRGRAQGAAWLEWRGKDGVLHEEGQRVHPWKAYQKMVFEGARFSPALSAALLRQCHIRLPWSLLQRRVTDEDISFEVVPSCRLFEALVESHPPTDRLALRNMIQSHFRYLCKAKFVTQAERLMEQHSIKLSMPCYMYYLSALVAAPGVPKDALKRVIEVYREFRDQVLSRSLAMTQAVQNAVYINLLMLRLASVHGNEGSAIKFFAAFRVAKSLQARLLTKAPPSMDDCWAELEFPDWQLPASDDGIPRLALDNPYGPNQYVKSQAFIMLLDACSTTTRAYDVFRTAVEQSCADAKLLTAYLQFCTRHEDAVKTAGRGMSALDLAPEPLPGNVASCWAVYFKILSDPATSGPLADRSAAAERVQDTVQQLPELGIEMTAHDATLIARSVARATHTPGGTWTADVAATLEAFLCAQGIPKSEQLLQPLDTIRAGLCPSVSTVQLLHRSQRSGPACDLRRPPTGTNLGDVLSTDPAHSPNRDLDWEKARTYGTITDAVGTAGCGDGVPKAGEAAPGHPPRVPWHSVVEKAARDFHSQHTIFHYTFAGTQRKYRAGVSGKHPYEALEGTIKDLGGTASMRTLLYRSAGDGGVGTLLQLARLRLIYALSVTLLGGFEDVVLKEVGSTQALFQEAGSEGAAHRWTWKAMQMYEDEVDDIIRDHGSGTSLNIYTRATKPLAQAKHA